MSVVGDDVRDRGEGDPARDGERRQRRDQGDDLRGRARALVPGEPAEQDERRGCRGRRLPAHRRSSGAIVAVPSAPAQPQQLGALLGGAPRRRRAPARPRSRSTSRPPAARRPARRRPPRPGPGARRGRRTPRRTRRRGSRSSPRPRARRAAGPAPPAPACGRGPCPGWARPATARREARSPTAPATTIASASRCRSPPERSRGSESSTPLQADGRSAARPASPGSSSPTRSRTKHVARVLGQQGHAARRSTRPRAGSISPAAPRSRVLLPAPLRPISATRSPARAQVHPPQRLGLASSSTQRSRTRTGSCPGAPPARGSSRGEHLPRAI